MKQAQVVSVGIAIDPNAPQWGGHHFVSEAYLVRMFNVALQTLPAVPEGALDVSLLLTEDGQIRQLNKVYRGCDSPTNVLSFPSERRATETPQLLGDIVLCWSRIEEEARSESKTVEAHVTHLLLHGFLHLLGYTHDTKEDASVMELLESHCMQALGFPDPWI